MGCERMILDPLYTGVLLPLWFILVSFGGLFVFIILTFYSRYQYNDLKCKLKLLETDHAVLCESIDELPTDMQVMVQQNIKKIYKQKFRDAGWRVKDELNVSDCEEALR